MKLFYILITIGFLCSSCDRKQEVKDELLLEQKLSGQWKAKAFDGELHEFWRLGENGWMVQEGHYIEKKDTTYSAISRIEKLENDVVLVTLIKNGNPKIFKASTLSDSKIIFENADYKNPYRVIYEFIDTTQYKRTIIGRENDSIVTYEFNFNKIN